MPRGDHRQGAEIRRVAVARDDLGRDRLGRQPQPLGDIRFHARIEMGEGADRAGDRRHRDLRPRRHPAGRGCGRIRRSGRRASDRTWSARHGCRGCGRWSACACARRRAPSAPPARASRSASSRSVAWVKLHRQAGVQHVGAGHALVDEAAVRPDRLGEPGEEGDHVMAGLALDRVDPLDVGRADTGDLRAPPFARIVARRRLRDARRSGPCPRRPAPRSRTRCGSGSRAPRWRPSRGGCSGGPSWARLSSGEAFAELDRVGRRLARPHRATPEGSCRMDASLTHDLARAGTGDADRYRAGRR